MPPAISTTGLTSHQEQPSAPPVRTPKLAYKNRSESSSSGPAPPMPGISAVPGRRTAGESNPDDEITVAPSEVAPVRSATRQIDWAMQTATEKRPSQDAKAALGSSAERKTKKKSGSFFNFLAVKEPTSGALEQYAQLQKKQAAKKGTAFMSGVSSQKLPAEVPKVNTKWDGLPQTARPDLRRTRTGSITALHGARRNSSATTNSSSKLSRRSQKSAASSTAEFDFGPPPSREGLSIKSNPRHDSGTGVYDPIRLSQSRDGISYAGGLAAQVNSAPRPKERPQSSGSNGEALTVTTSAIEPTGLTCQRSQAGLRRNSHHKASAKTIKEIAPWAEPPGSSSPWPPHPGYTGADDVDFITASPLEATPTKSIADQIAEAERRTASLISSRMPPSSNAQALSRLEPTGNKNTSKSADTKAKQKKGKSKFAIFSGKS